MRPYGSTAPRRLTRKPGDQLDDPQVSEAVDGRAQGRVPSIGSLFLRVAANKTAPSGQVPSQDRYAILRTPNPRRDGGTGRRSGLKIRRPSRPWGFDPPSRHQLIHWRRMDLLDAPRLGIRRDCFNVIYIVTDPGFPLTSLELPHRRAGIPETVIMKIGWRTRSVFERYAIVSRTDIADATASTDAVSGNGRERGPASAAARVPSPTRSSHGNQRGGTCHPSSRLLPCTSKPCQSAAWSKGSATGRGATEERQIIKLAEHE